MTDLKRSQSEIVARMKDPEVVDRDTPWGVERSRYLMALEYENAREFLRQDQDPKQWNAGIMRTEEQVREEAVSYLRHAWEKANGQRALSAQRSLLHFAGLLWLIGSPEADSLIDELDDWTHYGKPQLVKISDLFGFPWREHDDGKWCEHAGAPAKTADEVMSSR